MKKKQKSKFPRFCLQAVSSAELHRFLYAVEQLVAASYELKETAVSLAATAAELGKRSERARKANATRKAASAAIGPIIVNAADFAEKAVNGSPQTDHNDGNFAGQD